MKKVLLIVFIFTFLSFNLMVAQNKYSISGIVYDIKNGETLIGATVVVEGESQSGTISNAYGYYSITLPKENYNLIISYIGYEPVKKEIKLDENKRIDIRLKPDSKLLNEVVVNAEGKNHNITSTKIGIEKLNPKEIVNIPVLLGEKDVIKTMTLTPGVKTSHEGSGGLFVRGGNNSQNLILLDEATVYNSSHMMGFFSTFNSDAIKDLTLYKGTAPAEYGGRISSVMDVKMNDGNNQSYHIGGGIGLISSRLNIEGPIIKDKGSFLVTGRRTYADLFLKLSRDEEIRNNQLYFYDLNLKANYSINENNKIFLSGYFGRDVLNVQDFFKVDWGNITGTLRWNHIWERKLFSNTSLIYSQYDYYIKIDTEDIDFGYLSEINNLNLKQDFQYFINSKNTMNFGMFFLKSIITPGQLEVFDYSQYNPIQIQDQNIYEYGTYISHQWKPNEKLKISGGLRLNAFNLIGPGNYYSYYLGEVVDTYTYKRGEVVQAYYNLEPRLNIAYVFNPSNSIKLSYTKNTQNIHLIQNSTTSTPTDIWIASSKNIKPEIGDQLSTGYFKNFDDNNFQLSGEVYYKWMQNQLDLKDGADINANEHIEGELLFGKGRAYGVELMFRKKYGRLSGWASYTLSRTEKQIENINKGNWYPARQDATHDVSVVGIYSINNRWTISASWVYLTGNAVTFPSGKYEVNGNVTLYYTERNGYRMPPMHRLDLGATLQLKKTNRFESSLNFSLYNAYGQKNAYSIEFEEDPNDSSKTVAIKTYLFTYVPSITYNFKF